MDELLTREGNEEKRSELRTLWGPCEESEAEMHLPGADADFETMFNSPPGPTRRLPRVRCRRSESQSAADGSPCVSPCAARSGSEGCAVCDFGALCCFLSFNVRRGCCGRVKGQTFWFCAGGWCGAGGVVVGADRVMLMVVRWW